MEKQKVKQEYDTSAEIYDSRYSAIQNEKYQIMLSNFSITNSDKILDVGCGTGMLAKFLGREIIGVDISLNMLKKAKTVAQADSENLPFEDSSFDIVMSFTCLQNLEDPEKTLSEIARVLKEGGRFVLTILDAKAQDNLFDAVDKYFHLQEITNCGEDIGFVAVKKHF